MTAPPVSFLATRRGRLLLLLLCAVQFLDVVDSSIMNVALPSIRRDLGFSAQGLEWVLSGYLVTYGGPARSSSSPPPSSRCAPPIPVASPPRPRVPASPGQVPAPELAD